MTEIAMGLSNPLHGQRVPVNIEIFFRLICRPRDFQTNE